MFSDILQKRFHTELCLKQHAILKPRGRQLK